MVVVGGNKGEQIQTAEIDALSVTIPKVEAALTKSVRTVFCSFETNMVGTFKYYFPMKVTINKIRTVVTKAVAGTDTGTVTPSNSVGAMANGVVTVAISAALAEEDSATPTSNNVIAADSYIQLVTAKNTKGGELECSIEYTITA